MSSSIDGNNGESADNTDAAPSPLTFHAYQDDRTQLLAFLHGICEQYITQRNQAVSVITSSSTRDDPRPFFRAPAAAGMPADAMASSRTASSTSVEKQLLASLPASDLAQATGDEKPLVRLQPPQKSTRTLNEKAKEEASDTKKPPAADKKPVAYTRKRKADTSKSGHAKTKRKTRQAASSAASSTPPRLRSRLPLDDVSRACIERAKARTPTDLDLNAPDPEENSPPGETEDERRRRRERINGRRKRIKKLIELEQLNVHLLDLVDRNDKLQSENEFFRARLNEVRQLISDGITPTLEQFGNILPQDGPPPPPPQPEEQADPPSEGSASDVEGEVPVEETKQAAIEDLSAARFAADRRLDGGSPPNRLSPSGPGAGDATILDRLAGDQMQNMNLNLPSIQASLMNPARLASLMAEQDQHLASRASLSARPVVDNSARRLSLGNLPRQDPPLPQAGHLPQYYMPPLMQQRQIFQEAVTRRSNSTNEGLRRLTDGLIERQQLLRQLEFGQQGTAHNPALMRRSPPQDPPEGNDYPPTRPIPRHYHYQQQPQQQQRGFPHRRNSNSIRPQGFSNMPPTGVSAGGNPFWMDQQQQLHGLARRPALLPPIQQVQQNFRHQHGELLVRRLRQQVTSQEEGGADQDMSQQDSESKADP